MPEKIQIVLDADVIELALQLTMKILQTAVRMMKDLRVRALLAPVNVRYMYWSEVRCNE